MDVQPVLSKRLRFASPILKPAAVFVLALACGVDIWAEDNKEQPVVSSADPLPVPTPEPSKAANINLSEIVTDPLGEEEALVPGMTSGAVAKPLPEEPLPEKSLPKTPSPEKAQAADAAVPDSDNSGGAKGISTAAGGDATASADSDSESAREEQEAALKPSTDEMAMETEERLPLILLDAEVPPGTSTRLAWTPKMSFMGIAAPTAVLVINGVRQGPTLCLTGAVHGDELNGIEIIRHVAYGIDPRELSGAVIGVPIVNLQGFRRSSRYLPDRRDLNRYFPGNPNGSSASRIAHSFFEEVISHCDMLVDIHTGSFHRTNLPQLRADLAYPQVKEMAKGMGAIVAVQSKGHPGSLRRAAVEAGITAITLEAGQPHELQKSAVNHGIKSLENLMDSLGMLKRRGFWDIKAEPIYYSSRWVRATQGGILFSDVDLGDRVKKGDLLGTVTDPITNMRANITAPEDGRVIGMALNQVMYPGFAAYHLGLQATAEEAAEKATEFENEDDALLDTGEEDVAPDESAVGETNNVPGSVEKTDGSSTNSSPEPLDRFGVLEDSE